MDSVQQKSWNPLQTGGAGCGSGILASVLLLEEGKTHSTHARVPWHALGGAQTHQTPVGHTFLQQVRAEN